MGNPGFMRHLHERNPLPCVFSIHSGGSRQIVYMQMMSCSICERNNLLHRFQCGFANLEQRLVPRLYALKDISMIRSKYYGAEEYVTLIPYHHNHQPQ